MKIECQNCYHENENQAMSCKNCAADLIGTKGYRCLLILTDKSNNKVLTIDGSNFHSEEIIIGREGDIEPEFFADNKKISRKQCRVIFEVDTYKIEHLATATNPTKLNFKNISPGIKEILRDGDILTLADKDFKVSISIISAPPMLQDSSEEQKILVITCNICGRTYRVSSLEDKIEECEDCDEYDKYKISRVSAREISNNAN